MSTPYQPVGSFLRVSAVGPTAVSPRDYSFIACDTTTAGAGIGLTLPALAAPVLDGDEITIENTTGAFDVSVTPNGTNQINGGGAGTPLLLSAIGALPAKVAVTLVADIAAGMWRIKSSAGASGGGSDPAPGTLPLVGSFGAMVQGTTTTNYLDGDATGVALTSINTAAGARVTYAPRTGATTSYAVRFSSAYQYQSYPALYVKGSTGHILTFALHGPVYWADKDTWNSSPVNPAIYMEGRPWMRLKESGANVLCQVSANGVRWITVYTAAKAAYLVDITGGFGIAAATNSTESCSLSIDREIVNG